MRHTLKILLSVCLSTSLLLYALTSHAAAHTILVFGDSLSAGYGLARAEGWVNLLSQRLQEEKYPHTVINASISGETSAGGKSRFAATLKLHQPNIVILELGANDGLRGLPVNAMQENLSAMISSSKAAGAKVVLVGVRMPPNYGSDYTQKFAAVFPALAKQHKTALVPFLFEGFAEKRDAFQSDNLHPTAASQPQMLNNVWQVLKPLIKSP